MPVKKDLGSPSPLLAELFRQAAAKHPQKIAVVQGGLRISFQELSVLIQRLAAELKARGIESGSLVGLCLPNSIAYIALTYAVWQCGGVVVPIATELPGAEVDLICMRMQPQALISHRPLQGAKAIDCAELAAVCFFREFSRAREPRPIPADMAFIRFTSGTTGAFKGVALTHQAIVDRITALNKILHIESSDTIIWLLSMAHHFVSTIVLYLCRAATIVLVPGVPADHIIRAVEEESATILYAAPFHYSLLAADPFERMLSSIRLAISTTIALPEPVFDRFYKRFGLPIVQAYGIIETGLICVNSSRAPEKKRSVGKVVPGYFVEMRDLEYGEGDAAPFGRLFVKGPGFFNAYFSPFRPAEEVLQDGWFDTGDIGRVDSEGFVYILGRQKDLINVAGMKVFPQEVETILDEHPGIQESHVYGMEAGGHGEMVVADVVTKGAVPPTEKDLRAFCRKRIAAYKVPEKIRFVDRLERTAATAKIIRRRPQGQKAVGILGDKP